MKIDRKYLKLFVLIDMIIIAAVIWFFFVKKESPSPMNDAAQNVTPSAINSFEACAAAGNPIMESFPEQCAANGRTFTNTTQNGQ